MTTTAEDDEERKMTQGVGLSRDSVEDSEGRSYKIPSREEMEQFSQMRKEYEKR